MASPVSSPQPDPSKPLRANPGVEVASARGRANGERGKRAERALVTWLRAHGWPHAERTVRTGHRVPGRVSADRGDVDGTPGIVWQCKDVQETRWHLIPAWLDDTEDQRRAAGANVAVLVLKRRGYADPGSWWAWVMLDDLVPVELYAVPVRLFVRDLAVILRHSGYGERLDEVIA